MNLPESLLPLALALLGAVPIDAANWPAWRGPQGTGVCPEKDLPLYWSATNHIRWKAPLPDRGNSTPIVWGDRVFVTQAIAHEQRRALLCFDRMDGHLLWQQGVLQKEDEPSHATNPQCAASPVTDGQRVVAWFGSAGLYCYDLDGKELWRKELGKQNHIWGNASSPVLYDNLCLLNFGPGEPSFLVAMDARTGKELWRVTEPNADSGVKKPEQEKAVWAGSWSTPVLIRAGDRPELILSWPNRLIGFEPRTGRELWWCDGLNPLVYTSPLYDEGTQTLVAMGGFSGKALAVKAGGSGDVTAQRLWHHPRTKQRIGSGVIYAGHIYIHTDPSVAECFELQTGKLIWEERLKGAAPKADNWSSLVLAGDRLYSINQSGEAFVLKASPKFTVLATNAVGETTMASLVPSHGEIFIRTYQHLWCVGNK